MSASAVGRAGVHAGARPGASSSSSRQVDRRVGRGEEADEGQADLGDRQEAARLRRRRRWTRRARRLPSSTSWSIRRPAHR